MSSMVITNRPTGSAAVNTTVTLAVLGIGTNLLSQGGWSLSGVPSALLVDTSTQDDTHATLTVFTGTTPGTLVIQNVTAPGFPTVSLQVMQHYGTPDLIEMIYGPELYNYVFDLDGGKNPDPSRVEWASVRGDERVDIRLNNSIYQVPLVSTSTAPLRFVPNWWAVFAFAAAYQVRGRQLDDDKGESKYSIELARVNREIRNVLMGAARLNAVLRTGATTTPIGQTIA